MEKRRSLYSIRRIYEEIDWAAYGTIRHQHPLPQKTDNELPAHHDANAQPSDMIYKYVERLS